MFKLSNSIFPVNKNQNGSSVNKNTREINQNTFKYRGPTYIFTLSHHLRLALTEENSVFDLPLVFNIKLLENFPENSFYISLNFTQKQWGPKEYIEFLAILRS